MSCGCTVVVSSHSCMINLLMFVCVCACMHEKWEGEAVKCCCYHDKGSLLSVFLKRCSSGGLICSVCSERCIKCRSEVVDGL